jgi:hypothetical protein
MSACSGAPNPDPRSVAKPEAKAGLAPAARPTLLPEPPLVPLRTGKLAPRDEPEVPLRVVARQDVGEFELLELSLPPYPAESDERDAAGAVAPGGEADYRWRAAEVLLTPGPGGLVFVGGDEAVPPAGPRPRSSTPGGPHLWVRRAKSQEPITGALYTPATRSDGGSPGHHVPFHASIEPGTPSPPDLERTWATAAVSYFSSKSGPFAQFAAYRLRDRYLAARPTAKARYARVEVRSADLATLMDTMTGRLSVQEALQRDRGLYLDRGHDKAAFPVAKLTPPDLSRHPWVELRKALKLAAPDEPLAHATPAEFYFIRARELGKLLDLVDVVEQWGQPAADILDGRGEDRGTFARYQAELGLARTPVTRILGPELVTDLAIVGSDPYLHEGTDLTLLFRVKSAPLFRSALAGVLAGVGAAHGGTTESTFVHEGVTVVARRSADGAVRQHRATVGDVELVSNSPGAIRRVISTIRGTHPRLADEPDFGYMLARDAATADDVLAYMGDRFVEAVVGPRQKVAEARRELALAELSTPGYAALLSGWLDGRAPVTTDELVRTKLLSTADLRHADGAPLDFQPGREARSKWGTVAALEPLIDLPEVLVVTGAEKSGYESFARGYESLWSDKIDPVALRLTERSVSGRTEVTADLRVLPLLRREYREMTEVVGTARVLSPAIGSGLRVLVGLGKDATLRRELTREGRNLGLGGKLAFDWIGDYAFLGIANRSEVPNALRSLVTDGLEPPTTGEAKRESARITEALADFPVYAAISVESRLGATVALAALREMARQTAPGAAEWTTAPAYRSAEIVKVTLRESGASVSLYYSLLQDALVLALSEAALRGAVDQLLDAPPSLVPTVRTVPGTAAVPAVPAVAGGVDAARAAQVIVDLAGDKESPLHRVAAWLGTAALMERMGGSPNVAEAVLRGDAEAARSPDRARAIMRATFGVVSLTPDGEQYALGPDGVRDPRRGTPHAPVWPALPVSGSPLEHVLSRLARLRSSLSFDDEPGGAGRLQSLHARVSLELRP